MKPFFRSDLIHLTEQGHEDLADEIYNQVNVYNSSNSITWGALRQTSSN
jgi:hypothetical protein